MKTWLAAQVVNSWLARWWRRLTVLALLATMIGGCSGCLQIPDWTVDDAGDVVYEKPEGGAND